MFHGISVIIHIIYTCGATPGERLTSVQEVMGLRMLTSENIIIMFC